MTVRIGHGFDLHRLEAGRPFILGGQQIEHDRGAVAHSDGDVVYHAVTDAILGAMGEQDLGQLFPDEDPRWENVDSKQFIVEAVRRMQLAGWGIGNLDITVILERPNLAAHKPAILSKLATLLGCDANKLNVKGKTHEQVDALGENRAVACHAVVVLEEKRRQAMGQVD